MPFLVGLSSQKMNSKAIRSFSLQSALFFCMHLLGSGSVVAVIVASSANNETDRAALLALKGGISKDPLGTFNSWNDSLHFCQWNGVRCSRRHHQRVAALILPNQGFVGHISPSIANLTFLRGIDLSNNSFNGKIPHEIGHLFRLRFLNLSYNYFGGEIPIDLANCSGLNVLYLTKNSLEGSIPVEVGSMQKLYSLFLSRNNLRGSIPHSIGNLSALISMHLSKNSLDGGIPNELGQLRSLTELALYDNKLSGVIPSSFYNLSSLIRISTTLNQLHGTLPHNIGLSFPSLEQLYMSANQFTGQIPISLCNVSSLQVLELARNGFTGNVPMNLGNLKKLQDLNLYNNQLGSWGGDDDDLGFFTPLTNCSNIKIIQIGTNKFSGKLPTSITNLSTSLTQLWVPENKIHGEIPTGIENLINLVYLSIEVNHLSGPIPYGIGKLKNLKVLAMDRNMLTGKIPISLGNITHLNLLLLYKNILQGSIPVSLGNFQNIEQLNLSKNNLSGTIPSQFFNVSPQLFSLRLSFNSFTGQLASEIGNLKQLSWFYISHNKLSGEIPSTLGDCESLTDLSMAGNFFQGPIPSALNKLGGLSDLDLSRNNLSGHIPEFLGRFPSLIDLNLSFNNLEGEVPKDGVFKNASAVSVLGNKNLCGGIPELQLPKCKTPKKQGKSLHLKITIPVICVSLSLILLSGLWFGFHLRRNQRRKSSSTSFLGGELLKVSYGELLRATDGFSSANLIGVGSYGSVYKGILDHIETAIAVKVLNLQQQGASKSFMVECDALRSIRHRNLVKIITACSSIDFQGNDFKALVFEYMPCGSLEKWLHPDTNGQLQLANLSLMERLNIAIDVASALEYLHHHGQAPIVHRDLKPSNVLLDNDMTAHVTDFGLAKFLPRAINNTHQPEVSSSTVKGSVGYLAPEYGLGGNASIEGDVYSYGILLLEIFTRKRPTNDMFKDGLNLHQFAKMHLPRQLMEIIDPQLVSNGEVVNNIENGGTRGGRFQECLVSIIQVGVTCSAELPRDRMDIRKVATELKVIRDIYHDAVIHGER